MPPPINQIKTRSYESNTAQDNPIHVPRIMDTLDLVVTNKIDKPRKYVGQVNGDIKDFLANYFNFLPVLQVITQRHSNRMLSTVAYRFLMALDDAMYEHAYNHSLEFYTHVIVLFDRYLHSLSPRMSERHVLDGLICAMMTSAKVCLSMKTKHFVEVLEGIYQDESVALCDIMIKHINTRKSVFNLYRNDFWLSCEYLILETINAIKNNKATNQQKEYFKTAIMCLPGHLEEEADRHDNLRNLIADSDYLTLDTMLKMERAFLAKMDWRVSVLCNKEELHQFMSLCWHYASDMVVPIPNRNKPSVNLHYHILYTFEDKLKKFGKVKDLPPFTPAPPTSPSAARRNDDDDNDNEPAENVVTEITFAFDALSLRQQKFRRIPKAPLPEKMLCSNPKNKVK